MNCPNIGPLPWRSYCCIPMLLGNIVIAADLVSIAEFSAGHTREWQTESFAGHTEYTLTRDDGRIALKAVSRSTASGLYREIEVDLRRTPYLNWSWRVDLLPQNVDERSKSGDDYAARVYVVVSGGILFWRSRALNYVWSSNQPVGSEWASAYTDQVRMLAVRSGADESGRWLAEKRNVQIDLLQGFGEKISQIDGVAIMTDTDDSAQNAVAWYGDIWFSAE